MTSGIDFNTMTLHVEYASIKQARARFVEGVLHVRMPIAWTAREQALTLERFKAWGLKRHRQLESLAPALAIQGRTWAADAFERYVLELNAETFGVPVRGVRIGQARLSRLAQVNVKTGVLTFSRHAIDGMPPRALRYLVLHELAHLIEANHSRRFWQLIARFEPEFRFYRSVAQAHHARACHPLGLESPKGEDSLTETTSSEGDFFGYMELDG